MKKILLYGLGSEKNKITQAVAGEFDIELYIIEDKNLDKKVLELFGEDNKNLETSEKDEKLMVFSNMDRNLLKDFLIALKNKGVTVEHKCVLTDTNKDWKFSYLMEHIKDEHRIVGKFRELGSYVKLAMDKLGESEDAELKDIVDRALLNKNELNEERLDNSILELKKKLGLN
ncbi:DUF3783 domain-containing protein [Peptoniphilus sp. MSJ-1]|uniref:DUF3783 domain-containing protein n=1 Tax=Peptoniphilus ovalis TaxID=2841503 RepID=A0ABS6FJ06_9FIRM|nr:DUF3783 domain-containing protein [Peptoniphilus ovalis]